MLAVYLAARWLLGVSVLPHVSGGSEGLPFPLWGPATPGLLTPPCVVGLLPDSEKGRAKGRDDFILGEGMDQLRGNDTRPTTSQRGYGDAVSRFGVRTSLHEDHLAQIRQRLAVESPDDICSRLESERRFWLVSHLIANDGYGVFTAETKAGKTSASMDLALAVAYGGSWLERFDCSQGPVVCFCGEGSPGKTLRRHDAICDFYGYRNNEAISYAHRGPHFGDFDHLTVLHEIIDERRPALVIIDPAYLAARGTNHTSIFDTGEVLENVQEVVKSANAAICVVHQWNRGGREKGQDRMSGAGWDAWGRYLINMSRGKPNTNPETGKSVARLGFTASGDEVSVEDWSLSRDIWADDPNDINSPLHYSIENIESRSVRDSLSWLMAKVSKHLELIGAPVARTSLRKVQLGKNDGMAASPSLSRAIDLLVEGGFVRPLETGRIEHSTPFTGNHVSTISAD